MGGDPSPRTMSVSVLFASKDVEKQIIVLWKKLVGECRIDVLRAKGLGNAQVDGRAKFGLVS